MLMDYTAPSLEEKGSVCEHPLLRWELLCKAMCVRLDNCKRAKWLLGCRSLALHLTACEVSAALRLSCVCVAVAES